MEQVAWMPQPGSQAAFLSCPYWEVLYQGTRGGGKTDALIMDFAQHVGQGFGPAWKGILFRQAHPQLEDVLTKTKKWFPLIFPDAIFKSSTSSYKWEWSTGEQLLLRSIDRASDYSKFHGHEYPWIGWEELTNWATDECYEAIKSVNRSSCAGMPRKYRATCNPWGPGHSWVKRYFIDAGPSCYKIVNKEGRIRCHISSHLEENKILMEADPDYIGLLRSIPDPVKRAAWLMGDWDIAAGGFFEDIWKPHIHVIKPFKVPSQWQHIIGFDWGSAKPFSLGIWAVSDGSLLPDGRQYPKGSLIRVKEWYGCKRDPNGYIIPDKGLRLSPEQVAKGIEDITKDLKVRQWVADPACFREQGGSDIMRKFNNVARLPFRPADNERIPGWQQMINLMYEATKDDPEKPGLWVFDNCKDFIRTIPALMRDERNPEDADTKGEDHIADEARYVCQTVRAPITRRELIM